MEMEAMDMSELKPISPLLDGYAIGESISSHDGVRCYPAMPVGSDAKYIIKVVTVPASEVQFHAFLLSGVYPSREKTLAYFKDMANGVVHEAEALRHLSRFGGFTSYESWQTEPLENGCGYQVYLLGTYKNSLQKYISRNSLTQLEAVNLGLDLCAALTTARNAGCLCVDVKPENIFIGDDGKYRIGDLGFIPLSCLSYSSLPDRYHSPYSAPELSDPMASVSATADVYSMGLILYQVYNNGVLPEIVPGKPIPAPEYADYEMAEIILKAIDPNPAMRWEDPRQMGQFLVSYMQRNPVNDTPIIPPADPDMDLGDLSLEDTQMPELQIDPPAENPDGEESDGSADSEPREPDELAFLQDLVQDESAPSEEMADEISHEDVSGETAQMLSRLDELVAHEAPAPVVPPEPIEVPMPEPIPPEPDTPPEEETMPSQAEGEEAEQPETDEPESQPEESAAEESEEKGYAPEKKKSKLKGFLVAAALLALVFAGIFYAYQFYYLQNVDSLVVNGDQTSITVQIKTEIPESKLKILCTDAYGNTHSASVENGSAVFSDLTPDTLYQIRVTMEGFHKVSGSCSAGFSTKAATNILNLTAATGAESSSAIVSFSVDGVDCEEWILTYRAEGEEAKSITFSGHLATLNDLTVGKTYTLSLSPNAETLVTGNREITFVPSRLIYAENVSAVLSGEKEITVSWQAPEGTSVEYWTVHCLGDNQYDQTVKVFENTCTFTDVAENQNYAIEITAAGMTQSVRTTISTSPKILTGFVVEEVSSRQILLGIRTESPLTDDSKCWLIRYSVNGIEQDPISVSSNSAVLSPVLPGGQYEITLTETDGSPTSVAPISCTVPEAENFDSFGTNLDNIVIFMLPTPDTVGWGFNDVSGGDYTTYFDAGEKASYLFLNQGADTDDTGDVGVVFAVYSGDRLLRMETRALRWETMWTDGYCAMDIEKMPAQSGNYHMDIFFDGQYLNTIYFTIN